MDVPVIDTLQLGKADTPPLGTMIVHTRLALVSVPVRVPVNATVPVDVEAVTEPDTAVPLWLKIQVICPEPVESDTGPDHVPCTDSCGEGVEGAVEPLPLPHAVARRGSTSTTRPKPNTCLFFIKVRSEILMDFGQAMFR